MNQMTEDDKYALKRAAGVLVAIIVILVVIINVSSGGKPLESSFEVVDKYKECDVVRYAPHQVAEYKYFLHCPKYRDSE